jgi:hypothetical protein
MGQITAKAVVSLKGNTATKVTIEVKRIRVKFGP